MSLQVSLVALLLIGHLWKENFGDRSFSAFHHTQEASLSLAEADDDRWLDDLTLFLVFFSSGVVHTSTYHVPRDSNVGNLVALFLVVGAFGRYRYSVHETDAVVPFVSMLRLQSERWVCCKGVDST